MAEDENKEHLDGDAEGGASDENDGNTEDLSMENIIPVSGMYESWFLDYASYVILERAVPLVDDGLKPVQRRILHAMKSMDDGRYNKVANIIGESMKYHPHGDASIGEALVQLGQKELLIDTQGNWGNTITGDSAAAPRYIEARISEFAKEVVFNKKTTEWQLSYDGRNYEPIALPIKFPLLLAQGAEGIAVGLACKILPHNFNELIDGSIDLLKGKTPTLYPDFLTGGLADFSQYNDGKKGGRVRVRAKITKEDNKTLLITEIPFGTTTSSLIDSIVKANDKGKIKIKKVEDNTSEFAEIKIYLPPNTSPDKTIDGLFAFTDCEVSIAPNSTVIDGDKPAFLGIAEILQRSTDRTVDLLKKELEIRKGELEEQWHFASLEKIFIEEKIYRDIEECETWEAILEAIHEGLKPHIKHLKREVTDDDVTRLTEIRIKRISKYDSFKAEENIRKLEEEIADINHKLENLVDHAISYFKHLKQKFGKGKERRTEIRTFDTIEATKVTVANKKLYVNRKEGFIGHGMKKEGEQVGECSDIDNIIVFRDNGTMIITQVDSKKFVGQGIIYAGVWKRGDKRTIYHLLYEDGKGGPVRVKRFNIPSATRDKEYDLTKGTKGSSILYFSVNPNGRSEILTVTHRQQPRLKKLKFDVDLGEVAIKGRGAQGNIVTKKPVNKVVQRDVGSSTLGARKIWYDDVVNRLNAEERGAYLGEFSGDDKILTVNQSGNYKLTGYDLSTHFDEDLILIEKFRKDRPLTAIYYDGEKQAYKVKRFIPEQQKKTLFITEQEDSFLELVTMVKHPRVKVSYDKRSTNREPEEFQLDELIGVKGEKAKGNQLTKDKVNTIDLLNPEEEEEDEEPSTDTDQEEQAVPPEKESPSENSGEHEKGASQNNDDNSTASIPEGTREEVQDKEEESPASNDENDEEDEEGQITLF